jgi:hypothetical protein
MENLLGCPQAASMDQFIAAHASYLDTILQRALLEERSAELASKLVAIFELCLRFKVCVPRRATFVRHERGQGGACGAHQSHDTGR